MDGGLEIFFLHRLVPFFALECGTDQAVFFAALAVARNMVCSGHIHADGARFSMGSVITCLALYLLQANKLLKIELHRMQPLMI